LLAVALAGCAARAPTYPPGLRGEAQRTEAQVTGARMRLAPAQSIIDLKGVLHLYSLLDDQAGQARIHLRLARLQMAMAEPDAARSHLQAAAVVARRLGDRRLLYDSHFLLARLDGDRRGYETALGYADSPLQRAVVLAYLDRPEQAYRELGRAHGGEDENPDDRAFVLYRYARARGDRGVAEQALALFKQAENGAGIADSLYLLGRLAADAGRVAAARTYLERGLTVAGALGDGQRVDRYRQALDAL
jgi:tetratricopeptide (TPR) repeat protein